MTRSPYGFQFSTRYLWPVAVEVVQHHPEHAVRFQEIARGNADVVAVKYGVTRSHAMSRALTWVRQQG